MRKLLFLMAALALLLTACGSDSEPPLTPEDPGKVGVILPGTVSSARWESADRKYLEEAFKTSGVEFEIANAEDDPQKFTEIANQMMDSGVKVLMITNLDSDSAASVIKTAQERGVKVIDYDRLTLGGGANYYVSFDNYAVGQLIGEGLVKCMRANGDDKGPVVLLNGSPTDYNATLFQEGYETVLRAAGYKIAGQKAVPNWSAEEALGIFRKLYNSVDGKMVGVAAGNDGVGGAAIEVLTDKGEAGKIPVTGQDATDEGLRRLLLGTQCMTVYKAIKQEAEAAAKLAVSLARGETPPVDQDLLDPETGVDVPAILLVPEAVTKQNIKDVINDGYTTAANICTTKKLKRLCTEAGLL